VLLPLEHRPRLGLPWVDAAGQYATLVWRGGHLPDDQLADHEHVVP